MPEVKHSTVVINSTDSYRLLILDREANMYTGIMIPNAHLDGTRDHGDCGIEQVLFLVQFDSLVNPLPIQLVRDICLATLNDILGLRHLGCGFEGGTKEIRCRKYSVLGKAEFDDSEGFQSLSKGCIMEMVSDILTDSDFDGLKVKGIPVQDWVGKIISEGLNWTEIGLASAAVCA